MDSLINKLSKIESDIASEFILSKVDSLGKEIKELEVNLLKRTDKRKENSDIELNIEIVLQAIKEFNDFSIVLRVLKMMN